MELGEERKHGHVRSKVDGLYGLGVAGTACRAPTDVAKRYLAEEFVGAEDEA